MPEATKPAAAPIANRILAALPDKEYQRLLSQLEEITLTFASTIYEQGEIIRHVYFPNSGIVSLLAALGDRESLEVGIVGSEGMIGLPVFLSVETSNIRAVVQGEGFAMRMKTADFTKECGKNSSLPRILRRYTHSFLAQVSQSAVCYRFHPVEARLARWLLMTADRMKTNEFKITQDFLSNMLGVRREAVNKSVGSLQKEQLIGISRGVISILDRAALEETACKCYRIIRDEEKSFPAERV